MLDAVTRIYPHISKVDQHRPFSSGGCTLLVEAISPDFVTHEMSGPTTDYVVRDFVQQRAHFGSTDESYK
jgi:hypothetical protein